MVRSEPGSGEVVSSLAEAETLPLPDELPDPVELRDDSEALDRGRTRPPSATPRSATSSPSTRELHEELNEQAAPWRILETSNKYTGETQAVVSEALGPEGQNIFASASDYAVIQSFLVGGKPSRDRRQHLRAASGGSSARSFDQSPPEFYAAVQLQQVIPQETKPGQAPPTPVRDETQPIITVILKRVDGHLLRRNAIGMTFLMGVATAVLCGMLHRRDKLAQAQRAAVAGAS